MTAEVGTEGLLVVTAGVALGSLLKGITGIGGPLIAIPVLAAFLGVERAVVVMAVPGVAMNAWQIWEYRRDVSKTRHLGVLTLTGMMGVALGTWALATLDERILSAGLAAAVIAYLITRWVNPTFQITDRAGRLLSPFVGFGSGAMQGSTGISAPVVATYVHGFNLSREGYVLAVSALFGIFSVAQVVGISVLGLYTPDRLIESALACIPAVALIPAGNRIGKRMSARAFNQLVLASLAGLAVKLLVDVFA